MKALLCCAMCLVVAGSGCASTRGKKRFNKIIEGGAEWGGDRATEGATVQFGTAEGIDKIITLFTFVLSPYDSKYTAADRMEDAFDDAELGDCRALQFSNQVFIECEEASPPIQLEYIRYINHESPSEGEWVKFETGHAPGGLELKNVSWTERSRSRRSS